MENHANPVNPGTPRDPREVLRLYNRARKNLQAASENHFNAQTHRKDLDTEDPDRFREALRRELSARKVLQEALRKERGLLDELQELLLGTRPDTMVLL